METSFRVWYKEGYSFAGGERFGRRGTLWWGGKWLTVAGSLVGLVASVGLVVYGPAVVRILNVLTWRFGQPKGNVAAGMASLSAFALLFAVATAVALAGQVMQVRGQSITRAGRILLGAAGVAEFACGLAVLVGVWVARSGLAEIATSTAQPTAQDVARVVAGGELFLRLGFAVLVVSQALVGAAAWRGFEFDPPRVLSVGTFGAIFFASVAGSLLVVGVCAWNGRVHGLALDGFWAAGRAVPHPAEIAGHLSSALTSSLLVGLGLMTVGVAQGLAGYFASGSTLDA